MKTFGAILMTSFLFAACSSQTVESLGKLKKIEIFHRTTTEKERADLILYRISTEKRQFIFHRFLSDENPDREIGAFTDSLARWEKLYSSNRTKPIVVLHATDFSCKSGKIYDGETRVIFYPDEGNQVSIKSVDFSWKKFPSGGLFRKIEPNLQIVASDRLIGSFDIGVNVILKTELEKGTKDAATGP
jgi:hypothetical protein